MTPARVTDCSAFKAWSASRAAGGTVLRAAEVGGVDDEETAWVVVGADEFLPDFLVWKPVEGSGSDRPLYRVLTVEVKYRANLGEFLRRYGETVFSTLREQWPDLYFVFVTDHPENGRSCFQVVDLREYVAGQELTTTDLHQREELDIWRKTVEEYESLVMQVFPLLRQAGLTKP